MVARMQQRKLATTHVILCLLASTQVKHSTAPFLVANHIKPGCFSRCAAAQVCHLQTLLTILYDSISTHYII